MSPISRQLRRLLHAFNISKSIGNLKLFWQTKFPPDSLVVEVDTRSNRSLCPILCCKTLHFNGKKNRKAHHGTKLCFDIYSQLFPMEKNLLCTECPSCLSRWQSVIKFPMLIFVCIFILETKIIAGLFCNPSTAIHLFWAACVGMKRWLFGEALIVNNKTGEEEEGDDIKQLGTVWSEC